MYKKVVVMGGGTGISYLLKGLKNFPIDITAVFNVSDNGSSTGKLREQYSIPAVGDIRKVISNLSPLDNEIKEVMEERIAIGSKDNKHAIGNLILTSLFNNTGSLKESINRLSQLLQVKHTVLPLSEDNLTLISVIHRLSCKIRCFRQRLPLNSTQSNKIPVKSDTI